ncbi:hypothetical protein L484_017619 [Morus notabilis]|uniref:Uncharacterized protein n=1 Tax=Morus notabilis TaxID=981085 RepID=W9S8C9_9ROSA|nr:hypothetical protein L484_017619 [Morus notabilis]
MVNNVYKKVRNSRPEKLRSKSSEEVFSHVIILLVRMVEDLGRILKTQPVHDDSGLAETPFSKSNLISKIDFGLAAESIGSRYHSIEIISVTFR